MTPWGHPHGEQAAFRSVTISTPCPAWSAGMWAYVASPAYLQHIDPAGSSSAPGKVQRGAARRPRNNSPLLSPQPASIRLDLHPPRPVWRSNWIASGSQACHENGVPTPVTTDYRNLCRILDKTAEKPAIGSALALPRNRCRLYDLGALGSPAFLVGQCGLSKTLARRFVSHCRSFIRSGNHLPRPYVRKNK